MKSTMIISPFFILSVVISYFVVLLFLSWYTSRKADNNSFFIGNKQSPWFIVAFGMIGASLSGVTFISVPGWVVTSKFYYMQMVLGYLLGYVAIIHILLPLYYRLNLTSIYTYLFSRFGRYSYKTGAGFFLISRTIGASLRLFIVANVLQITIFNQLRIPFVVNVGIMLLLIYLFTYRGGVKTIIWTDTFQTFFMLLSVVICVVFISHSLHLNFRGMISSVAHDERSTIFDFAHWRSGNYFIKEFLSGAFIAIAMTGLDQDLMQKNLSCRNLKDAQKNMYWYSSSFVVVNLLFLSLGVLLLMFAENQGIALPKNSDDIFPMLATGGYMPAYLVLVFVIGLTAATYSSADSALTSLTTSFTIDILEAGKLPEEKLRRLRITVHVLIALVMGCVIFIFKLVNSEAVISSLFKAAGYTYGPLLGLFSFGLFTRYSVHDKWVPVVAILSPILCYLITVNSEKLLNGYRFGFEILLLNGLITFIGLLILVKKKK
jgi:solute:Na+ symporter, SSS family